MTDIGLALRRGTLVATLCVAGMGEALAQNVPRSVSPGQIEKRFEVAPKSKERVDPIIPAVRGKLAPEEARRIRFVLTGIVIEGATVFPEADFIPLYEGLLAREVSLADLYGVAQAITKKYTDAGYLLTQAVIPPQEMPQGIVRIRVVEGYLDNIIFVGGVTGSTRLLEAYARKITEVQPLRQDVLERYILLMNDLPGLTAKRRLVPTGTTEGAYNLIITITQDKVYGFSRLDNRGSRSTGPVQLWFGGGLNSALGMWENTQARVISASNPEELLYGDISHTQVIGTEGTKVTLLANFSNSEPGTPLAVDEIDSTGFGAGLTVNHPLIRSRKEDLFIGGQLGYRKSDVTEFGFQTIDENIFALRLFARYGFLDSGGGRNNISFQVSQGLDIFDATDGDDPLSSRAGASSSFTKFNIDVSRFEKIAKDWGLFAAITGQKALNKLANSEQIGIGGEQFGRAYDPSEIAGDDGVAAKVEFQYTSAMGKGIVRQHQIFAYIDGGAAWRRDDTDFGLGSVGLGVRLLLPGGVLGTLELAKPIDHEVDQQGTNGTDPRLFFVISGNF